MAYFTTTFEFIFDVKHLWEDFDGNYIKDKQDINLFLSLNSAGIAKIYIDEVVVIEIEENDREVTTIACNKSVEGDMY
jgi:hypothetical protein